MEMFSIKDKPRYIEVTVVFKVESGKKLKNQSVTYLVDAMTVTEAEGKTIKYLTEMGEKGFDVRAANPSKVYEVID